MLKRLAVRFVSSFLEKQGENALGNTPPKQFSIENTREYMEIGSKRKRSLQLVVLTIILSFVVTTIISVRSLDSLIRHNAQSLTNLLSSGIYDAVSNEITKISMVARTISQDILLVDLLRSEQTSSPENLAEKIDDYLSAMKKGIDFDAAFIIPILGEHIYGLGGKMRQLDPANNRHDAGYVDFVSEGRPRIPVSQPDVFNPARKMFFIFSRIVDKDGRVAGVCGIGMPLENMQSVLRKFEREYAVRLCLADWDENCTLSSDEGMIGKRISWALPENYRQNRDYAYAENAEGGYVITRYLDEIGRFLVIRGAQVEGKAAFSSLIRDNVIAIVAIFLALFIITHFLMRSERGHLEKKAFTDQLTGIANRAGFEAALEQKVGQGIKNGSLFILDLDHFKEINDTLGHPEGDKLLQFVAKTLKTLFRESDIVARLGGDEFVVFAQTMDCEENIVAKANSLIAHIHKIYELPDGESITVTASIGIALFPKDGATYELLYKNADTALYASKENGKNRFTIFRE